MKAPAVVMSVVMAAVAVVCGVFFYEGTKPPIQTCGLRTGDVSMDVWGSGAYTFCKQHYELDPQDITLIGPDRWYVTDATNRISCNLTWHGRQVTVIAGSYGADGRQECNYLETHGAVGSAAPAIGRPS